jgi:hypothetical protein
VRPEQLFLQVGPQARLLDGVVAADDSPYEGWAIAQSAPGRRTGLSRALWDAKSRGLGAMLALCPRVGDAPGVRCQGS